MTEKKNQPNSLSDSGLLRTIDPFRVSKPVVGINPEEDADRDVAKSIQKFRENLEKVRVA